MKTDLQLAVERAVEDIRDGKEPSISIWLAADRWKLPRADVASAVFDRAPSAREWHPPPRTAPPRVPPPWAQEQECERCAALVGAILCWNGPHVEMLCEECGGHLAFVPKTAESTARIVDRPPPVPEQQTSFAFEETK